MFRLAMVVLVVWGASLAPAWASTTIEVVGFNPVRQGEVYQGRQSSFFGPPIYYGINRTGHIDLGETFGNRSRGYVEFDIGGLSVGANEKIVGVELALNLSNSWGSNGLSVYDVDYQSRNAFGGGRASRSLWNDVGGGHRYGSQWIGSNRSMRAKIGLGQRAINLVNSGTKRVAFGLYAFRESSSLQKMNASSSWLRVHKEITTPIASTVPEPATWLMLLLGFALTGFAVKRRHTALTAS